MKSSYDFVDGIWDKYEQYNTSSKKDKFYKKHLYKKTEHSKTVKTLFSIIILIVATAGVTYSSVIRNFFFERIGLEKLGQNYENSKVSVDEKIDNEYVTISLNNIARDSAYIILEYDINLKEEGIKQIGEIIYDEKYGFYNLFFDNLITLNNEKVYANSFCEKVSDNEYTYYQIINTMIYDSQIIDLKIWIGSIYTKMASKAIDINETIELSAELDEVKDSFEKQEQRLNDGSLIILDKVANTNFQTFIRIRRIIDETTWKEYQSEPFKYKSFFVTDLDGNELKYVRYGTDLSGTRVCYKETGEYIDSSILWRQLKDDDKITIEENYTILLEDVEDLKDIKIYPAETAMYNDRTNEEREYYNKATWYPLVAGDKTYTATNNLGGTLKIGNITINDEQIIFHYTSTGIIGTGTISKVLIRENNGRINYICANKEDNGNEGTIVFNKDQVGNAGLGLLATEPTMLQRMENLEFTLLFGSKTEFEAEPFETQVPKQVDQKVKIIEIKKEKNNTATVKLNYRNTDFTYEINYDKNGNIVHFEGNTDILTYKENEKWNIIKIYEYKNVDELLEEIQKSCNALSIEYAIERN